MQKCPNYFQNSEKFGQKGSLLPKNESCSKACKHGYSSSNKKTTTVSRSLTVVASAPNPAGY